EDIFPDGSVALVAGGLLNGTQAKSIENPARMRPGETYDLTIPLHFTTWTYRPGHRMRLSVSNAQFPMIWPTPYPMTSVVHLATAKSVLELPVIPPSVFRMGKRLADLAPPEPRQERPDVKDIDVLGVPSQVVTYDPLSGINSVQWKFGYAWTIGTTRYDNTEQEFYETNESNPAASRFLGVEVHRIRRTGRDLRLETTIDIRSDSTAFNVRVLRRISEKGKLVAQKEWKESIPREFH
ncbi:MAG TPA: CocE/NonD family hydrolase C-terminal non-catalytic domain-containing protein, partial [Gemmatimonadales bacterium]|nr:CocE/NonD family hydrolase C-terminal non-catalytic domain-containing protein [Gemmatimonadales bacterium]